MLNCNANVIPQLSFWGKCQLLQGESDWIKRVCVCLHVRAASGQRVKQVFTLGLPTPVPFHPYTADTQTDSLHIPMSSNSQTIAYYEVV